MHALIRRWLLRLLLPTSTCVFSAEPPLTLADCAGIVDAYQRLACYDKLAADSVAKEPDPAARNGARAQAEAQAPAKAETARREVDVLARHWELDPAHKQGTFVFRPHDENYLLIANFMSAPNEEPFSPFKGLTPEPLGLSKVELKYQLGFKMKMLEDISPAHADLWFGYTQQSNWQAYNRKASSPFRDTNYQPELMAVVPLDFRLAGIRARFLNVGFAHQSNGQALSLSRSWNRLYAQLGMESGSFTLLARVWKRTDGGGSDDDNPDILDYMGHGDIDGTYRWKGHEFSVLARRNFKTSRGALRASWAFPLTTHVKGYVQAFSGYGQSLIDYNYSQQTIGIGVLIREF